MRELLDSMDAAELAEWQARDLLKNDDYREKLEYSMMSPEQRAAHIDKLLS